MRTRTPRNCSNWCSIPLTLTLLWRRSRLGGLGPLGAIHSRTICRVCSTESASWYIRSAIFTISVSVCSIRSALPWPALSAPRSISDCTYSGNCSSRRKFEMLHGVQVLPLQVLDDDHLHRLRVRDLAHHRGGAAAVSGDELI